MTRFCPRCHRLVPIPDWVRQVKAEKGITISCGNCRKGKIVIRTEAP